MILFKKNKKISPNLLSLWQILKILLKSCWFLTWRSAEYFFIVRQLRYIHIKWKSALVLLVIRKHSFQKHLPWIIANCKKQNCYSYLETVATYSWLTESNSYDCPMETVQTPFLYKQLWCQPLKKKNVKSVWLQR